MSEPGTSPAENGSGKRAVVSRYVYHILGAAAVLLLVIGTVVFHYLEGWSWVDSFYFSAVAGTTVGFGDLAPTTDASKLFSVLYIFFSIGVIGTFLDQRLRYHGVVRKRTQKVMDAASNDDQS